MSSSSSSSSSTEPPIESLLSDSSYDALSPSLLSSSLPLTANANVSLVEGMPPAVSFCSRDSAWLASNPSHRTCHRFFLPSALASATIWPCCMALVRRRGEPSEPPPPLSAPNRPTTWSPTLSCSGLLPFLRFDRLALTFFAAGRPVGGVRCASAAAGETAASAGAPSSSPLSDDASDDDRARRGLVVQRSDTSRHKTKNNVLPHQPMEHAGPAVAQARTRRSQQYPTRTTHGLTDGDRRPQPPNPNRSLP